MKMIELNQEYELSYPAINDFIHANIGLFKELYIRVDYYYTNELRFMDGSTHKEIDYIIISDISDNKQFEEIFCENNNMEMFELIINFISELRKYKVND